MRDGVRIDGVQSEAEDALSLDPYDWSCVADPTPGGRGGWLNRLVYDPTVAPVRPTLYYNDDAESPDPPEDEAGQCGDGIRSPRWVAVDLHRSLVDVDLDTIGQ